MAARKKVEISAGTGIRVRSNTRGVEDPVATFNLTIPVHEVESAINCGFQILWGTVDVDGEDLEIFAGAGMGSGWATIDFKGKSYAIGAHELVAAFLEAL